MNLIADISTPAINQKAKISGYNRLWSVEPVKDISQLHGLKLGKRITWPNALLTMKTQLFSMLIAFRFVQQEDL